MTEPEAVRLLFDLRASRMLAPFLSAEHTLSTAAGALGVAPSTLAHWLPTFVDAGLLVRTRVQARRGAPMPWYRTPAPVLFVPMAAVPAATRLAFLDAGRRRVLDRFAEAMDDRLARSTAAGITFASHGPVGVDVDLEPAPAVGHEPWTEFWGVLRLGADDARALAAELAALLERYRARDRGTVDLVVLAGAVPVSPVSRHRRSRPR